MTARLALILYVLVASVVMAEAPQRSNTSPTTTIGPRNVPLHDGAQALLAGRNAEGVRLTLQGLQQAVGSREEAAALSNLCAGYIMLEQYDTALNYCNTLLDQTEKNWRAYNNRAVIYIKTSQWDKAEQDLLRGEALNPGAHTMKVARAMYMDAVHPVLPEVEIDDSKQKDKATNKE